MDYLRLTLGLLLPWIGGYFWLGWLERRLPGPVAPGWRARQLGLGLFVGFAALYLFIQSSSLGFGRVDFLSILGMMALFAMTGAWLYLRLPPIAIKSENIVKPPWKRPAYLLLAILAGLHLALGLGEVLNLPVFPWDAWIAWIYRAKAWFYSGHLATFVTPREWLEGSELYTMAAAGYPEFPSVMPFWVAVCLGYWSETLVNVPVALCGLGLGLAVYGSGRGYGLGPLSSLLAAYLLLSIPMIGTHLSLAGYADIWMTAYAGLGMLMLLVGLGQKQLLPVILGMAFLAFSIEVKNEGFVWLYLGLMVAVISILSTRQLVALIVAAAVLAVLLLVTQTTHVALPWLGTIGIENGHLHLPFIKTIQIHQYPLITPYRVALLEHGSWNLLAVTLTLAVTVIAFSCRGRERVLLLSVACGIVLSQIVIFGYTEQGRWAVSYTAINRLPMQMAPVMVFITAVALGKLSGPAAENRVSRWLAWGLPVAALVAVCSYVIFELQPLQPTRHAPALTSTGGDMRAVMGRAIKTGDTIKVTAYQDGVAIISAKRGRIAADLYQHLEVDLFTDGNRAPAFFWRTASKPADLQILDIDDDGSITDLSGHPSWHGNIIEIGLAFYDSEASISEVSKISLQPASTAANLHSLLDGWWSTLPWRQESINWIKMGQDSGKFQAVSVLSSWIMLTTIGLCLLAALPPRASMRRTFAVLTPTLVIAWLAMDLVWLHQREDRLQRTLEVASQSERKYIAMGGDKHMARLAQLSKEAMPLENGRVMIASDDGTNTFEPLRLKYHLLPLNAHILSPYEIAAMTGNTDAVLLVTMSRKPNAQWLKKWEERLTTESAAMQRVVNDKYGKLMAPPYEQH